MLDPASVRSNIVVFGLTPQAPDANTVVARARDAGVLVVAFGPRTVRAVTHLDVTEEQCLRAAEVLVEAATSTGGTVTCAPGSYLSCSRKAPTCFLSSL